MVKFCCPEEGYGVTLSISMESLLALGVREDGPLAGVTYQSTAGVDGDGDQLV